MRLPGDSRGWHNLSKLLIDFSGGGRIEDFSGEEFGYKSPASEAAPSSFVPLRCLLHSGVKLLSVLGEIAHWARASWPGLAIAGSRFSSSNVR